MPHFERELPTYAEPVSASNLTFGETYFSVQYSDEDMLLPIVETLILTGTRKDETGETVFCFQDLESYTLGIRHGAHQANEAVFYFQSERNLNHIFEYEHGLDEPIRCSIRRRTVL